MITCEASRWWRRYVLFAQIVAIGGGLIMLSVAAAAHAKASIPLLIIGAAWLVMGALSRIQVRRAALRIVISNGDLSFIAPSRRRQLPASELVDFRWGRGDFNRLSPAVFTTNAGERITVAPRMTGLLDLLLAIKQCNQSFQLPRI